jgi:hypothetical protein
VVISKAAHGVCAADWSRAAPIGYVVWPQWPNFRAWIGIASILAAGFLAIASTLRPRPLAALADGV